MKFIKKNFKELTLEELYEVLKLREEIFVIEQKCSCIDIDGYDAIADHIYLKKDDKIVSYARLFNKNTRYNYASIGRMCTDKDYRGQGLSKSLINECIKFLLLQGNEEIIISAQKHAEGFYSKSGFYRTPKKPYMEENIPHVEMKYKIEGV